MLHGLEEYGLAVKAAGDLSVVNVLVIEVARQDGCRKRFGTAVATADLSNLEEVGEIFRLGLEAGYSVQEVVVLADVWRWEEWYWMAHRREDEAVMAMVVAVERMEAEQLAVLRNLVLLLGLAKAQVDVIRFFKERYDVAIVERARRRVQFRDAINAKDLTEDELMDYISSKMTVIPERLLKPEMAAAADPTVDNLERIGTETEDAEEEDFDDFD